MSHRPNTSPLMFHVRDIARSPGSHREVQESFPVPQALGTSVISVPEGAELELTASLESVAEGIWVSGTVQAEAIGECGRCLDEVRQDVDAVVQGLFTVGKIEVGEDDEEPEDVFEFDGENLDLEDVVRDAVVTQLPFTPLCRPDCPGLCDQCGARLVDDPDHAHEVIDPRWSTLQSLTEQKES
ncbi:YceD family protein [Demequina sediminicola]|uniref:YceD family protein n=1 Tax=Demequina sediminicola TaxID=1095026 RepID=UPI0007814988|nr:YceD family protein [Demequina sediminicola]